MIQIGTRVRAQESAGEQEPVDQLDVRRLAARGKFLWLGDEKFYIRGVTYGTFARNEEGDQYPSRATVDADFAQMAANGINAFRTYTVPPLWLLDLALAYGLRVMVGISWEDHVAFLESRANRESILRRVQEGASSSAGHSAVLCYAIGNEIPSQIARWYGRRRVQRFLSHLYDAAKAEDPDSLVTYVNFPSTEYLELPFLDFVSFNIYLESQGRLEGYLARLHNIAGDLPLVIAESGLDSRRNGHDRQADALRWQVESAFRGGCAGCFLFAWTDEWYRGGFDIDDWDFGLTDRQRRPKPALAAVRHAFAELPMPEVRAPRISVVVCCRNEGLTIGDCLTGLEELVYPDYEVIVVDDGSTDGTAAVASEFDVRLVSTENRGLAAARNLGLELATGEIVAYIDGDARPDPHWLTYLAASFERSSHVGIGGPNIPPPGGGHFAECVANAPGGPIHVLLSDEEAEHIPGCNMAFRKEALESIDGFDPSFRAAGDDVDICWRLQERGWTLGFSPTAIVWHRRRNSLRAFLRQQVGYGKAEALLERKWPERYNASGHVTWAGRLYANGVSDVLYGTRSSIYYGTWGTGLFQWRHGGAGRLLRSLPLMPEWYLLLLLVAQVSALGLVWHPLLGFIPLLALGVGALVYQACAGAAHAVYSRSTEGLADRARLRGVTALLYLVQPVARLIGRLRNGLTPWRRRNASGLVLPTLALAELSVLEVVWRPLIIALPLFALGAGVLLCWGCAATASGLLRGRVVRGASRHLIACFIRRLRAGLMPWRRQTEAGLVLPIPRTLALWDEEWRSTVERLTTVELGLQKAETVFRRGGDFDRWDLEVRGGILGSARIRSAIEEHGGGRQLVRFRLWPRCSAFAAVALGATIGAAVWSAVDGRAIEAAALAAAALAIGLSALHEAGSSLASLLGALRHAPETEPEGELMQEAAYEPNPGLGLIAQQAAIAEQSPSTEG